MASFTALYDACVLHPAPLRDLLMHLALTDLFRARWSNQIHDEWIQSILAKRPDLTRTQLERTRDLMNAHVRDCLVTGYESLIDGLILPDPDDRHVLAAAIRTRAHIIVTFNLKDFLPECLKEYGIEAQHPDVFVSHLLDLSPGAVCSALKRQRDSLRYPPVSSTTLLDTLLKQGLVESVRRLKEFKELL